jgi:type I restriction enzyme R subunit
MDVSEKNFESIIEATLLLNGPDQYPDKIEIPSDPDYPPGRYTKRLPEDYNRSLCLIPKDAVNFIYATQPKEWGKFKKLHGDEVKERFLKILSNNIAKWGTIHVLRKGIKDSGCKFNLAYFKPSSGLNPENQKLYEGNIFSIIRQLKYSEKTEHSLDLGIFLNGLPIFTAELKNPFKGQDILDAIRQYKFDRDSKEPLFSFGRCLAHFAIDPQLVYFTTQLKGIKTGFLPFNQGNNRGAGNPPSWKGFSTAYLWEKVWSQNSVLDLIQNFIHVVEVEDDRGRKTGKKFVIFPRYHQLDSVRRLVSDSKGKGSGHNYLIQHSAGSGKSYSIAWLAYQLSSLFDDTNKRIFDSVIIISDRRVIDRQLQTTLRQFQQTLGLLENIDKTSRQLKKALEDGKTIIVSTLQKYPFIAKDIENLPGKRFAIIIDEAHSSQTGESTKSLKSVLSTEDLEEAEKEDDIEVEDFEDRITSDMKKRGPQPNLSYFAFTATPKSKTLELFGTRRPDGKFDAFSLYSMRQAIEEKFILDVLENYTTYKVYWNLLKRIPDDPKYDHEKASYLLKQFVDIHKHTVNKKVAIIVEHFNDQISNRIDGKAKAMIVTRSRLHAVRYKLAVDQYIKKKGYNYKALVAFTGTVRDKGQNYTEMGMNGFSDKQTAETFKRNENRFLIAANKFQTGFDQPLLHTMYVDKKLKGVHAVQTLSRLNRIYPEKNETMVIDFANEASDIQKSFEPYYEKTLLEKGTDPGILYEIQNHLEEYHLYDDGDVNKFCGFYYDVKKTQDKLYAVLTPVVDRYKECIKEEREGFRGYLKNYISFYAFLSQIIKFVDLELEKLYLFSRLLIRLLPVETDKLPVEIKDKIDIDSFTIKLQTKGSITPGRGEKDIKPEGITRPLPTPDDKELLSKIIEELNSRFGTDFTEDDKVFIKQLEERLFVHPSLGKTIRVNPPDTARLTFDEVVGDQLQDMMDTNFKFYKQVNDDKNFSKYFMGWLFDRYLDKVKSIQL